MSDLMKEIDGIVRHSSDRATYFQLNFFILNKEPTIQAKLHRCVNELKSRKRDMENASLELAETLDKIALLEIQKKKYEKEESNPEVDILVRQIDRKVQHCSKQIGDVKARIRGIEEESIFWVEAFKRLSQEQAIRPWDDDEVQLEYWSAKLSREVRERLILGMPIDVQILREILVLPQGNEKDHILNLLSASNPLLQQKEEKSNG